jgi:hypothetical protein
MVVRLPCCHLDQTPDLSRKFRSPPLKLGVAVSNGSFPQAEFSLMLATPPLAHVQCEIEQMLQ